MSVTSDQVPMWTDKAGHALMWSEGTGDDTRWTQTLCGIFSNSYSAVPTRPKRICKECRATMARAVLKEKVAP